MIKIKKGRNITLARIISYEFSKENPDIESNYFHTKNCDYQIFSIFAFSKAGKLVGGINCKIEEEKLIIDEIWVKEEYRGMWIGKKMLSELRAAADSNKSLYGYYPHLNSYESFFTKNLIDSIEFIKNKKMRCG